MRAYTLTVSGSTVLSGSVIPEGSGSHDLGTANSPWKNLHVMSSSIHMYDTTGEIAKLGAIRGKGFEFRDHAGALTRITGSHMKLSSNANIAGTTTSNEFVGGGAGLTGVTAEWDGTHTGNGTITGDFTVISNNALLKIRPASDNYDTYLRLADTTSGYMGGFLRFKGDGNYFTIGTHNTDNSTLNDDINVTNINTLILDEADRMLSMGFDEDIRKIISKIPNRK